MDISCVIVATISLEGYTSTFIMTCLWLPTRIPPTTRIYIFKEHELCESTECVLNLQARNASSRAHRAHS